MGLRSGEKMTSQKLDQAVALIKAGNKQTAIPILKNLIQEEPNNEQVWLWMFTCVDKPEQKKYCLQKALEINPNNTDARKAFEKLLGKEALPSSAQPMRSQSQQPVLKKPPTAPPLNRPLLQTAGKKQPVAGHDIVMLLCWNWRILGLRKLLCKQTTSVFSWRQPNEHER
jgi:tetratricopeptide (TPR) repeat protein